MRKIVLYGAGNRGKILVQLMDMCHIPIAAIVDSNSRLWGQNIGKNIVESPEILHTEDCVNICITVVASLAIDEIRKKLKNEYKLNFVEVSYLELIMSLYEKLDTDALLQPENIFTNELKPTRVSVLFDCAYGLGLGGIEEWTKGICKEFLRHYPSSQSGSPNEKEEYAPYILTNYGDYDIPCELKDSILRVDVDKDMPFSIHNISQIMNCIAMHLPCILVTSKPEDALLAGKLMKQKYGNAVKVISGIRGGSNEIYQNYMDMCSCTDLYVCVSSDIRRNMISRGIAPDKIFTMICPINCPENLTRKYTTEINKPIKLGYAGRLTIEQKRMDLMVKLLFELEEMHIHYDFEFAGEGDCTSMLNDFINQNNCQGKVRLIGKIPNSRIPQFWQERDICINLADYEGRSRSIAEAMANGAIPIVTATSGVNDDILDGENGYIVDIGNYKAIARHVSYLAQKRDQLPEMGKAAYLALRAKSSMEDHYLFWQQMIAIVKGRVP